MMDAILNAAKKLTNRADRTERTEQQQADDAYRASIPLPKYVTTAEARAEADQLAAEADAADAASAEAKVAEADEWAATHIKGPLGYRFTRDTPACIAMRDARSKAARCNRMADEAEDFACEREADDLKRAKEKALSEQYEREKAERDAKRIASHRARLVAVEQEREQERIENNLIYYDALTTDAERLAHAKKYPNDSFSSRVISVIRGD